MCKTTFIPKEFGAIKEFRNLGAIANVCMPPIGSFDVNVIKINIPSKIIIPKSVPTACIYIPICINQVITYKRVLKYCRTDGNEMIHIKKVGKDTWYSGRITEDKDPLVDDEYPAYPPGWEEEQKRRQEEIERAQSYSDDELNDSQASGEARSLNVLQYVNMKLTAGRYEIYVTTLGLESNHAFVKIVFK